MTASRHFLPPPDPVRCCAACWCGYYMARCLNHRAPGSDVCQQHKLTESKGQRVRRVRAPALTGRH